MTLKRPNPLDFERAKIFREKHPELALHAAAMPDFEGKFPT